MRIEVLTFEGCPNAGATRELVRQALHLEGVDAAVDHIEVHTPDMARQMQFLGSPSVRVDSEDVELSSSDRTAYGLMCRTYSYGAGATGIRRIFKPLLELAGLPDVTFHSLRHTANSLLIEAGEDPLAIAGSLGHADTRMMFERYGHLFGHSARRVAHTANRVFAGLETDCRTIPKCGGSVWPSAQA